MIHHRAFGGFWVLLKRALGLDQGRSCGFGVVETLTLKAWGLNSGLFCVGKLRCGRLLLHSGSGR